MSVSGKRKVALVLTGFFLSALAVLCSVEQGNSRDYQVRRKTTDYVVDARINHNPPVLGINTIRIEVRDALGRELNGARISVNYYMPPMPRMVPMNYTVAALPSGRSYTANMNFIMTGPWNIVIRVQSGAHLLKVHFPIDVR